MIINYMPIIRYYAQDLNFGGGTIYHVEFSDDTLRVVQHSDKPSGLILHLRDIRSLSRSRTNGSTTEEVNGDENGAYRSLTESELKEVGII